MQFYSEQTIIHVSLEKRVSKKKKSLILQRRENYLEPRLPAICSFSPNKAESFCQTRSLKRVKVFMHSLTHLLLDMGDGTKAHRRTRDLQASLSQISLNGELTPLLRTNNISLQKVSRYWLVDLFLRWQAARSLRRLISCWHGGRQATSRHSQQNAFFSNNLRLKKTQRCALIA